MGGPRWRDSRASWGGIGERRGDLGRDRGERRAGAIAGAAGARRGDLGRDRGERRANGSTGAAGARILFRGNGQL
jgi:hypothetical protein